MTAISGAFALILISATVLKVIDTLKYAAGAIRGDKASWNGVVTQGIVWVAGVAVLFLAAHASLTNSVVIPFGDGAEIVLGDLDASSVILLGVGLGSFASTWNGLLGALDGSRSTSKPGLLADIPPNQ